MINGHFKQYMMCVAYGGLEKPSFWILEISKWQAVCLRLQLLHLADLADLADLAVSGETLAQAWSHGICHRGWRIPGFKSAKMKKQVTSKSSNTQHVDLKSHGIG